MKNSTKNQHFVAQFEQSIDLPNADSPHRKRIHRFTVLDPDRPLLRSDGQVDIRSSFAFQYLYSFKREADGTNYNFESLFQPFESAAAVAIPRLLKCLLNRNLPSSKDVMAVLQLKVLNMFRTPLAIRKTLNTIGFAAEYCPAHPDFRRYAAMIDRLDPAETRRQCTYFKVSVEEYSRWLRALLVILFDRTLLPELNLPSNAHGNTLFDDILGAILTSPDHLAVIQVATIPETSGEFIFCDQGGVFGEFPDFSGQLFAEFRVAPQVAISLHTMNIPDDVRQFSDLKPEDYRIARQEMRVPCKVEFDASDYVKNFNLRAAFFSKTWVYSHSATPGPGLEFE